MPFHPTGITVEIVGTKSNSQGRSCEHHLVCGSLLNEDSVVRIRKVQVIVDGKEEPALAAYLVSDGVDSCRVGFLPRHLLKHSTKYDGLLAQIIDVYSKESPSPTSRRKFHRNNGCCVAAIISSLTEDTITHLSADKKRAAATEKDASASKKRRQQASGGGQQGQAADDTSSDSSSE
jgi:5-methylcytosine-specific restriction endonuclease McrA